MEQYEEKDQLLNGLVELFNDELEEKTTAAAGRKEADKAGRHRLLGLQIRKDATKALAEKKKTTPKAAKGRYPLIVPEY